MANGRLRRNTYPNDMRLKQQTRILRGRGLASLRTPVGAFNSPDDEGRTTRVLLHLQHSFEMLMEAVLVENGVDVFDKKLGRSIGHEACVRAIQQSPTIKTSGADAGLLRAVDAMRDGEQHWINDVSEQVLYLHAGAGVTLLDDTRWEHSRRGSRAPSRRECGRFRQRRRRTWTSSLTRSTPRSSPCWRRTRVLDLPPEPGSEPCWQWRRMSSLILGSRART